MLHHHSKKAHYNFRAGPDENLAFPTFLSIVDAFQRISENVHAHHDACGDKKKCHLSDIQSIYPLNSFILIATVTGQTSTLKTRYTLTEQVKDKTTIFGSLYSHVKTVSPTLCAMLNALVRGELVSKLSYLGLSPQ